MGHRKFNEIAGEINAERRAEIDKIKEQYQAEAVAFGLRELREHLGITQTQLAEFTGRKQPSISAMEAAEDNLLSTYRAVVEGMGGYLEITAVVDGERIALSAQTS